MKIEIIDIHIRRTWAVWIPGYGPLGDLTDQLQVRPLPFANGHISISDRLSVPLSPMIGCIGMAPATGTASTLEPAYHFGGNLDVRELCVGATLLLPVQTSGAWLSVGDLHAAMGTGEPAHISLEAAGEATVRVNVEKNLPLPAPRIVLEDRTLCLSVLNEQGTIEQAAQLATRYAYDFLISEFSLTPFEAYAYISANVELRRSRIRDRDRGRSPSSDPLQTLTTNLLCHCLIVFDQAVLLLSGDDINGINCEVTDATPKTGPPSDPTGPVIPIARVVGPPEALVIGQQKDKRPERPAIRFLSVTGAVR